MKGKYLIALLVCFVLLSTATILTSAATPALAHVFNITTKQDNEQNELLTILADRIVYNHANYDEETSADLMEKLREQNQDKLDFIDEVERQYFAVKNSVELQEIEPKSWSVFVDNDNIVTVSALLP